MPRPSPDARPPVPSSAAVLILSCDRYAPLWPLCLDAWFAAVGASPFKVYVGSNEVGCADPRVQPVLSGPDVDWSSSTRAILGQVPEEYLLVLLEDLVVPRPLPAGCLEGLFAFAREKHASHVKLSPPPTLRRGGSDRFVPLHGPHPYKVSVPGVWRRDALSTLLLTGEDPWSFEIMGSYRASRMDGFWSATAPHFEWINLVEKGLVVPAREAQLVARGFSVPPWPRMNRTGALRSLAQAAVFNAVARVPFERRLQLMNTLRRVLISW